jgi:3-hydroxybutyryl-CoA dehydrogenase
MTTQAPPIAVLGAGTMGHGIAYAAALADFPVALYDADAAVLSDALARVDQIVTGGIKRGKLTEDDRARVLGRLRLAPTLEAALPDAALVIEAIVEDLVQKQRLFGRVERMVPADVVLATNTSSLPVGQIAAAAARPERVIGMHFFNPVYIMRLVEIVPQARTDDETMELALDVARRLGKEPIVVRDMAGFASSRLGVVLGLEAMRMLEQGVASAEDIDKAMALGYGHPMGPLRVSDLVGLDVRLAIAEILHRELEGEQYRAPDILRDKVAAGELGKKTGQGFYTWPG